MNPEQAQQFLKLLQGAMLAFATHLNDHVELVGTLPKDEEVEDTKLVTTDFLELFYRACEQENLPKEVSKMFKVKVLDVLGVM